MPTVLEIPPTLQQPAADNPLIDHIIKLLVRQNSIGKPKTPRRRGANVLSLPSQPGLLERLGVESTAYAAEPGGAGAIPPPPPGFKIVGTNPAAIPPPPPGFTPIGAAGPEPAAPAPIPAPTPPPREPFLARMAEYAPPIGQIVGEILGTTGAAALPVIGETGVGEMAGAGVGGGIGGATGEALREGVRYLYGLPVTRQIGREALISGATSAAGVPISKAIKAAIPGIRVARAAVEGYETAKQAARDLAERVAQSVKMSAARAAKLVKDVSATKSAIQAVELIRRSVDKWLSSEYETTLRPYAEQATSGTSRKAFMRLPIALRRMIVNEMDRRYPPGTFKAYRKAPTVAVMQDIRSAARSLLGRLDPVKHAVPLKALQDFIDAATEDMNSGLPAEEAAKVADLDKLWRNHRLEWPKALRQRIQGASSAAKLGEIINNPDRLEIILRDALHVEDPEERAVALDEVREALSAAMWRNAGKGVTEPQRLGRMMKFINDVPDDVFKKLYGMSKAALSDLGQEVKLKYDRMLRNPSLRVAVERALDAYAGSAQGLVQRHLERHLVWAGIGATMGGYESGNPGIVAGAALGYFGAEALSKVARSPMALRFYKRAVLSNDPVRIAQYLRAAGAALAAQIGHKEDR